MAKILVIDDDQDMVESIVSILKDEGYNVGYALNGSEAIKKAKQQQPDVILLDIAMPNMDGYEIFQSLKKEGLQSPVVIITARQNGAMNEKATLCLDEGAYTILYKPFDPDCLISLIQKAL
ncbi:TPA: two-component system response regulator [bacterium]|nr:two-component system response regulator [bacterium]